jgi:DNA-binding SARP family transcriptional activator/class 3 adenylate cyclase
VAVKFQILGPLEVLEGAQKIELGARRQRALLAFLLLHTNEVVAADRLIEEVWSAPPARARNAVQVAISRLRKALGDPDRLLTYPAGYLLRVTADECDRDLFEQRADEARRSLEEGRPDLAASAFRDALELWRGPPLADFLYEPFAQTEIARLQEAWLGCVEGRIEAGLALGRHAELVAELEALTGEHPFREGLWRQLMLALYRSGRQAEALEAYQTARQQLVEDLGIEPTAELRGLQEAILRQEATLTLPQPETAPSPPSVSEAPSPRTPATTLDAAIRKQVTVLVCGLQAPVNGGEPVDPEVLRAVLGRYLENATAVLERHGGAVETSMGNAVVAVFGHPVLHEDDALRAVRAAFELRERFEAAHDSTGRSSGVRLAYRIAIATGEVVAGARGESGPLTGAALAAASRLEQNAEPGEIRLGELTARLVSGATRVEPGVLSGVEDASGLTWFRLLEVLPGAPAFAGRFDVPLIGRNEELAQLERAFARAVETRSAVLVTVLGTAGLGKTRLAQELPSRLGPQARILTGRCLAYGEGITFWPLREIVNEAAGDERPPALVALLDGAANADLIAGRIASALGTSDAGAAAREEIFWAFRKLLEALARRHPLVLVLEDVHWAEPTLLDLVEHVAALAADAPMLVLCLARPELLEERAAWAAALGNATTIRLEPLSDAQSAELLVGLGRYGSVTQATIIETAQGNPFFLEQIAAMLAERAQPAGDVPLPATVEALLAARLERLGPAERMVVSRAAVIGKEFWQDAVEALLPAEAIRTAPAHLEALVRKQLLEPAPAPLTGEDSFRFRHVLVQSAAYRAVPKAVRATMHEGLATWIESWAGERAPEFEEFLAYHLEQAFRYRSELETIDDQASGLAARARQHLVSAGRLAFRRGDTEAAVNLLERASSVPSPDDRAWLDLACDVGFALFHAGEFERARRILDDAIERATTIGDRSAERHAWVVRDYSRLFSEPDQIDLDQTLLAAKEAIEVFEGAGDDAALSRAGNLVWHLYQCIRGAPALRELAEGSVEHARRADSRIDTAWSHSLLGYSLLEGPTPVLEAVSRCEQLLAELESERLATASVNNQLAPLVAMLGRLEEARALITSSRANVEEYRMGGPFQSALELASARVETLAGDRDATEAATRAAAEHSAEVADSWYHVVALIDLARAACDRDQPEECLRILDESERFPCPPDVEMIVKRPATRALALARLGRLEEAEALAREAVSNAAGREYLNYEADAVMVLAEVLRVAGRSQEAASALEDAVALYERKGNIVSSEKARALLAGLVI